jgi:hypothetical protein
MSFRYWFGLEHKPNVPETLKLGMRSPLVLAKIGYDMRQNYSDLIEQPLPGEIEQAVEQLQNVTVPQSPEAPTDDGK